MMSNKREGGGRERKSVAEKDFSCLLSSSTHIADCHELFVNQFRRNTHILLINLSFSRTMFDVSKR